MAFPRHVDQLLADYFGHACYVKQLPALSERSAPERGAHAAGAHRWPLVGVLERVVGTPGLDKNEMFLQSDWGDWGRRP